MTPSAGVRAIYAVLTYTTGFVAWEIPRTHRQPQAAYAASWRREFVSLPPADFPLCRWSSGRARERSAAKSSSSWASQPWPAWPLSKNRPGRTGRRLGANEFPWRRYGQ